MGVGSLIIILALITLVARLRRPHAFVPTIRDGYNTGYMGPPQNYGPQGFNANSYPPAGYQQGYQGAYVGQQPYASPSGPPPGQAAGTYTPPNGPPPTEEAATSGAYDPPSYPPPSYPATTKTTQA